MRSVFPFCVFFGLMLIAGGFNLFAQGGKDRRRQTKDTLDKSVFKWEKEPRKNMIQWNFLSTFVLAANFSYERTFSKYAGILVGGFAGKYPLGGGGRCLYVSPYSSFRFFKLNSPYITSPPGAEYTYGANKAESFNLSIGLSLGYRWILGNWFIINPYLGAGYNVSRFHFFEDAQKNDFNTRFIFAGPYEVRFGLNLGVALK
jgi:outer membrane autotransporter protein